MSHTVKVEVQFKTSELPHLFKAFKSLGWEIKENTYINEYAVNKDKIYPYVAKNPRDGRCNYDIGITPGKEEIELHTDLFDIGINDQMGENFGKLKQAFACSIIEDEYAGSSITKTITKEGDMLLEIETY